MIISMGVQPRLPVPRLQKTLLTCVEASPATGPAPAGGGPLSGLTWGRAKEVCSIPRSDGHTGFVRAVGTSFLGTVEEEAALSQALKVD